MPINLGVNCLVLALFNVRGHSKLLVFFKFKKKKKKGKKLDRLTCLRTSVPKRVISRGTMTALPER